MDIRRRDKVARYPLGEASEPAADIAAGALIQGYETLEYDDWESTVWANENSTVWDSPVGEVLAAYIETDDLETDTEDPEDVDAPYPIRVVEPVAVFGVSDGRNKMFLPGENREVDLGAHIERETPAAHAAADVREACLDAHGYGCTRAECGRSGSPEVVGLDEFLKGSEPRSIAAAATAFADTVAKDADLELLKQIAHSPPRITNPIKLRAATEFPIKGLDGGTAEFRTFCGRCGTNPCTCDEDVRRAAMEGNHRTETAFVIDSDAPEAEEDELATFGTDPNLRGPL